MANSRPNTSRLSCFARHTEETPSHSLAASAGGEAPGGVSHSARTKKLSAKTTNTPAAAGPSPYRDAPARQTPRRQGQLQSQAEIEHMLARLRIGNDPG